MKIIIIYRTIYYKIFIFYYSITLNMTSNTTISQQFKEYEKNETLLIENPHRFVMFPIQYPEFWKLYKKQIASFWTVEEIDLSHDMSDWLKLNVDEQKFIKHVLAFFAASDGIVLENLSQKFSTEIQIPEIRAFYGVQIAIENIHCVSGDTKILTNNGYYNIKDLENTNVDIWNGKEFSNVTIKYTGNQEIYKIDLSNGMSLKCSPGHKWLIQTGNYKHPEHCKCKEIETINLKPNDIINKYNTPLIEFQNIDEFLNPYIHGFFCGDGSYCNNYPIIDLYGDKKKLLNYFQFNNFTEDDKKIRFYITKFINKNKFDVPINYSINTRLRWLEGILDADGCINLNTAKDATSIQLSSINFEFLQNIQLLLTTLGILSNIKLNHKKQYQLLPTNNNNDDYKNYLCNPCYVLYISCKSVNNLINLGFSPKRLNILYCERINNTYDHSKLIRIVDIQKISNDEPTYCFNEPNEHKGIFNGILTCQSEMYSLLIDHYITDPTEKNNLFHAIDTIPTIKLKANWALKWINNNNSFAERIIAFCAVEGILFSGSFCSIYWLKKRGLMKGLSFSNELISRDEGLHTDFGCLIYNSLDNKLPQSIVHDIILGAVDVEKQFICEALSCDLIGINKDLMSTYIEYIADRLLISLNYEKLFNSKNPFDWMELISLQGKTNFFERRVGEYQKAGVMNDVNENVLKLDDDY